MKPSCAGKKRTGQWCALMLSAALTVADDPFVIPLVVGMVWEEITIDLPSPENKL